MNCLPKGERYSHPSQKKMDCTRISNALLLKTSTISSRLVSSRHSFLRLSKEGGREGGSFRVYITYIISIRKREEGGEGELLLASFIRQKRGQRRSGLGFTV